MTLPWRAGVRSKFVILILDKIVQFIEKAPPNGVAEYVIFGIENHIFPSHVIL